MTHLSLFLFFDVDLSPEKVVYYYQNTLSFVNKEQSTDCREKKSKQSQSKSILFKDLRTLIRACNQHHVLITRSELT